MSLLDTIIQLFKRGGKMGLSTQDVEELAVGYMEVLSRRHDKDVTLVQPELQAAFWVADKEVDDSVTSFAAALPLAAKEGLSVKQQMEIQAAVLQRKLRKLEVQDG